VLNRRCSALVPWTPLAKLFGDGVLMATKTCSNVSCQLNPPGFEVIAHHASLQDLFHLAGNPHALELIETESGPV
jgi:hypothetical protein